MTEQLSLSCLGAAQPELLMFMLCTNFFACITRVIFLMHPFLLPQLLVYRA